MIERIEELRAQAQQEIEAASSSEAVEQLRVRYLGRKAELPQMLRGVAALEPEQRGLVGKAANVARRALEQLIEQRAALLDANELDLRLAADTLDVTLPGTPPQPVGRLHVLTATMRELEDIFLGLGFTVLEGQEVETVHYNFDALNHSPTHPARAKTDTFYMRRTAEVSDGQADMHGGTVEQVGVRGLASRTTWCCARTPRRCRSVRWRRILRRCTSSSRAACTGPTATPPTHPSFTRSRAWRSTRTSRLPT